MTYLSYYMDNTQKQSREMKSFTQGEVECYYCHERGHIATNCPKLAKKKELKISGSQVDVSNVNERAQDRISR